MLAALGQVDPLDVGFEAADGVVEGYLGDVPPNELEAASWAARQPDPAGSDTNVPSLHQTQGGPTEAPGTGVGTVIGAVRRERRR